MGEELLGEIAGVFRGVALPASKGIEGIPIGPAEMIQRGRGSVGIGLLDRQHYTPVRAHKCSGLRSAIHAMASYSRFAEGMHLS